MSCIMIWFVHYKLWFNFFFALFAGSRVHWWHRRLRKYPTWQPEKWTHSASANIDHSIICYSFWNLHSRIVWHEHPMYIVQHKWDIWDLCWRYHCRFYTDFPACFRICQMEKASWLISSFCNNCIYSSLPRSQIQFF